MSTIMSKMLSQAERDKILYKFNDTKTQYSFEKNICQMFEEQVRKTPDNIAVICGEQVYTYKELNTRANQLATFLREIGVGPEVIVALMVERSYEMMVAIFAIQKAGGAYLPIDPDYPEERKKQILMDSSVKYILTQSKFISQVPREIAHVIDLNDEQYYRGDGNNLEMVNSPYDIAYVIYTSGSTGKPKGVLIEHHSLVNRLLWMQKEYSIGSEDVIMQKTTYTFDVSVWEIFWWSITGAAVCLLPPRKEYDPRAFVKLIEKHKVSVIHFVPSVLRIFMDYIETDFDLERIKTLKWVFSSGEPLGVKLVERFNKVFCSDSSAMLINLYGPTEATIDVSHFACIKGRNYSNIPIGKPIDNTAFYILDQELNILPVGSPGDLYVSGAGLARGYLNNPLLTSEKFINNPFIKEGKMYKTGDIAKWTEDGDIIYLGRADNQVKLRGLRIELEEIEYYISTIDGIKDVVVLVREDEYDNQFLTAYIIREKNGMNIQAEDVKIYLTTKIPVYMIPTSFVFVSDFPLKSNGKIDKEKLKAMPQDYRNI